MHGGFTMGFGNTPPINLGGAIALAVNIASRGVSSTGSGARTAGWRARTTGVAETLVQAVYTAIGGEWLVSGIATDAVISFHLDSSDVGFGTLTGTMDTNLDFSADREFKWVSTGAQLAANGGTTSAVVTATLKRASDLSVLDTATITMSLSDGL